jgi:hypothetical protein
MSRQFYQMPGVREVAREVRGRNKGIARAVKERKRIEARERAELFAVRPQESKDQMLLAIAKNQPTRYDVFRAAPGSKSVLLRIDLEATQFKYLAS